MSEVILSSCNISFSQNVFETGKKLTGKLGITFNKSVVISAVIARLYGTAEVCAVECVDKK